MRGFYNVGGYLSLKLNVRYWALQEGEAIAGGEGAGGDPVLQEDRKLCATLFSGLVFFIQREVPRDMMARPLTVCS